MRKKDIFECETVEDIKDFYIKDKMNVNEAFASGSAEKVMKLLAKVLSKKVSKFDLDLDIADGYKNSLGSFRGYTAYLGGDKGVRINFLLSSSDYIYSVDYFKDTLDDAPDKTIVFETNSNVMAIYTIILDLITGKLKEQKESYLSPIEKSELNTYVYNDALILEKKSRKKGATHDLVYKWIADDKNKREELISTVKLSDVYTVFVRTVDIDDPKKIPKQRTFTNELRVYLKDNGLINPFLRPPYKKKKVSADIPIILPEEKKEVQAMKEPTGMMFDWKDAFESMEDSFTELMLDQDSSPYGQVVFGNGGTGKSFFFMKQLKKYKSDIIKGSPSMAKVVKFMYDNKDAEFVLFDDADTVVTNKNTANILKSATDSDGVRAVYLPKSSGKDLKDIVPDVYGEDGKLKDAFKYNASVVIITNLPKVPDQALASRLYPSPIFMTKEDIIAKIEMTSNPEEFGCTKAQGKEVATFMTELVEQGFDVKDSDISYRFFKMGLKSIKHFPSRWKKRVMMGMKIGIRMKLDS